jgi:hypothetical protein
MCQLPEYSELEEVDQWMGRFLLDIVCLSTTDAGHSSANKNRRQESKAVGNNFSRCEDILLL